MNRIYAILLLLAVVFCSGCKKELSEAEQLETALIGTWHYDYNMKWCYELVSGKLLWTSDFGTIDYLNRMSFHPDGTCEFVHSDHVFPAENYRIEGESLFIGKKCWGKVAVEGHELILIEETVGEVTPAHPARLYRSKFYYRRWK